MHVASRDGQAVVTEGVIDLAVLDGSGWTVIDWKSDRADADEWARLATGYDRQVARYAELLRAVTARYAVGAVVRVGQQ
jgi:ATP-dependent exoDNAse (exonuclease V) beta subunit